MHLPWKKCKIGRISRLLSDLRSSKHGGSLVVETGFPTSLIDLIVKNRDRLKKSSSLVKNKKRINQQKSDSLEISENSTPFPSSSSSNSLVSSSSSSSSQITDQPGKRKIPNFALDRNVEEEVISSISSLKRRIFALIMKLFFFLILAIGTKKLAVAITMLAFILLFLEFSLFLKPCPNAKKRFNSVVGSVVNSVHQQKDELIDEQSQSTATISKRCTAEEGHKAVSMAKKEEQGSSSCKNEETQMSKPGNDSLRCGCRWGFTEKSLKRIKSEDLIHEKHSDFRNHPRRIDSTKLKSKLIKKFVPKKFRHSKKKRNFCNNEEDEQCNLHRGYSTSDLFNSQEEAEDDDNHEVEKHKNHTDDEHQTSVHVSQIEMQTHR